MNNKNNRLRQNNMENHYKKSADLEEALSIIGMGWYNIKYCLVLALFLIAAIVEPIGYGYVLPAAKCDLNMTDSQRGFIASVPYIGIVLASFPWGYLIDTRGRKNMVVYSSLIAGGFGVIAAFMPEVISFTICKLIASFCISCPAAVPYTFIGEIIPEKYRDVTLSVTNSMQILGAAVVPMLAMGILPLDFSIYFGAFDFRPWRLLCISYSSLFIIAAILMSFGPESPKYLVSQNKYNEALEVLQTIYAGNSGKAPDDFPIKMLTTLGDTQKSSANFLTSLKVQSIPLLKPPYVKWMALNGFLLFGIFSVCNGLYMWIPDVINRVFSSTDSSLTACGVIALKFNQNSTVIEEAICDDSIDIKTFIINGISLVSCAILALPISMTVKFIDKKILLTLVYLVMGSFCFAINNITQDMVFAALLLSLALCGLAIGPINAFAIEIFPTHLRGMAVSLSFMAGRCGSVLGANLTGLLINRACEATFYGYGGLLIVCALLAAVLLPKKRTLSKPEAKH